MVLLGDYRIVREVGRGGMGVVYEAVQESLGRRVALKVLPVEAARDAKLLARFRRESRRRPNCITATWCRSSRSASAVARSLLTGPYEPVQSVDATLDVEPEPDQPPPSVGPAAEPPAPAALPEPSALSLVASDSRRYGRTGARLGLQVAEALAYAHSRGIVHRDIKPSNLLLDSAGLVWVSDFGLAKMQVQALTETGDLVGTVRYMAPERFEGVCDARADVYALGLTLYELLLLRPAFDAPDRLRLMDQIRHQEPARPRALDARIPRDLETILMKAIEKDPRRRYPSAEALARDRVGIPRAWPSARTANAWPALA